MYYSEFIKEYIKERICILLQCLHNTFIINDVQFYNSKAANAL